MSHIIEMNNQPGNIDSRNNRQRKQPTAVAIDVGMVIEGNILSQAGNQIEISLQIGNESLSFLTDSEKVTGKVGDRVSFQVLNNDQHLVMKQVKARIYNKVDSSVDIYKSMEKMSAYPTDRDNSLTQRTKEFLGLTDEAVAVKAVVAKIKRRILYGYEHTGPGIFNDMLQAGLPIEKLPIEQVNHLLFRTMELYGEKPRVSTLEREKLSSMLQDIQQLKPEERALIIKNSQPFTIENIYEEKYKAAALDLNLLTERAASFIESKDMIQHHLTGILKGDRSQFEKSIKELWLYELPLTQDNILSIDFLQHVDELDIEAITTNALQLKERGESPLSYLLFDIQAAKDMKQQQGHILSGLSLGPRHKIEEISTLQAHLLQKINEIDHQEKIIIALLEMNQVEINDENIDCTLDSSRGMKDLAVIQMETYQLTANHSLQTILDTNASLTKKLITPMVMAEKLQLYENMGGRIHSSFGDSLEKALHHSVESLLMSLELESSEMNIKAVEILAMNEMEISEFNIIRVKDFHMKLVGLRESFTPYHGVNLLKNNQNPLSMTLDELLEYMTLENQQDYPLAESLAKSIYIMEKKEDISQETKEDIRNIYKLLHTIERDPLFFKQYFTKSGIDNKKEPTLEELLQYNELGFLQQQGIDHLVADEIIREKTSYYHNISIACRERWPQKIADIIELEKDISPSFFWEDFTLDLLNNNPMPDKENNDHIHRYQQMERTAKYLEQHANPVLEYMIQNKWPINYAVLETARNSHSNRFLFQSFLDESFVTGLDLEKLETAASTEEWINSYVEELEKATFFHEKPMVIKQIMSALSAEIQQKGKTSLHLPLTMNGKNGDLHLYAMSQASLLPGSIPTIWMDLSFEDDLEHPTNLKVYLEPREGDYQITFHSEEKKLETSLNANAFTILKSKVDSVHIHGTQELNPDSTQMIAGVLLYIQTHL